MKPGAILGAAFSVAALCGAAFLMLANASPYVTVAQAKTTQGNNLHLQGDLIKSSVDVDITTQTITFDIRDDHGDVMTVFHKGLPPANMGDATRVVAVGGVKNGQFQSHKIMTKCPSKYESAQQTANKNSTYNSAEAPKIVGP